MVQTRTRPYATLALAALITLLQGLRMADAGLDEWVMLNLNVYSWEFLYRQPWRVLTSPFLHQNLLHYLENLTFLLLFGYQIERNHGRRYLLPVFFGAMFVGHVFHINARHDWIIGISGGVCGLFGFSLVANRLSPWWQTLTHRPLHLLYSANLLWAVVVDIADWVPFPVAHDNHVVGILYGLAFAAVFLPGRDQTLWRRAVILLPLIALASQLYSPWQVEWRLVNRHAARVPEYEPCRLRSTPQDEWIAAAITFANESARPVAYYWLDAEGAARFFGWLKPGESGDMNSFITHPWCIVDVASGAGLMGVTVTETEQTITIR